eukprot:FR740629.1.p1 GENE.FR740629.1~~FR740629.1.p1  ORF type:complete len:315 (+),score=14.58 FR740629.1:44-946(+)
MPNPVQRTLRQCSSSVQKTLVMPTLRTNNSVKKKIATLKSITNNLFTLPPDTDLGFWTQSFGEGAKNFFIIGEQKCGTTALYDLLKAHPMVDAPSSSRKELHMFDHNHHIDVCRLRQYVGLLGARGNSNKFVGEATPDYLADPVAAIMVAELLPEAKIIVLTRDPVRRAHAAWDQNRRAGSEARSFKDAVRDEMSTATRCQKLGLLLTQGSHGRVTPTAGKLPQYVETCAMYIDGSPGNCWVNQKYSERPACKRYLYKGFYAPTIKFWQQRFPSKQIMVVPSETLVPNGQLGPKQNVGRS